MVGYPFVLPDNMIGGNGLYDSPPSKVMDGSKCIHGSLQFSYTPWDFDQWVTIFNKFKK